MPAEKANDAKSAGKECQVVVEVLEATASGPSAVPAIGTASAPHTQGPVAESLAEQVKDSLCRLVASNVGTPGYD